ncbi:hypothetical protein SAMN05877838_2123 [Hoeflea halophila]|uniref:Uncharacterized protein n=1 Tax=Hoeflea halophila TaxID=714899 RepID=A0A286IAT0_9HYPH|nr:hypothetical protein [Hoeflea halophila]SOE17228.1 hypothetical protein SAMN05877838_2123 [Hoeflea halophila]
MQVFIGIAYFAVGIIQLFAIIDGIDHALGWGGVISFILAMVVTYIPVLGSVLGVYGAVNAWDWSFWQAATLFFWYIPVIAIMGIASMALERRR